VLKKRRQIRNKIFWRVEDFFYADADAHQKQNESTTKRGCAGVVPMTSRGAAARGIVIESVNLGRKTVNRGGENCESGQVRDKDCESTGAGCPIRV
jgi:hypothetical protein